MSSIYCISSHDADQRNLVLQLCIKHRWRGSPEVGGEGCEGGVGAPHGSHGDAGPGVRRRAGGGAARAVPQLRHAHPRPALTIEFSNCDINVHFYSKFLEKTF